MAWKSKTTTLTGENSNIDVSITPKKCNNILHHTVNRTAAATNEEFRVGNGTIDAGTNYSERSSTNGAAEGTTVSHAGIEENISTNSDMFAVIYSVNIATEEKLFILFHIEAGAVGAATEPTRHERVGKWDDTTDQYDIIRQYTGGTDRYGRDSNMTSFGAD